MGSHWTVTNQNHSFALRLQHSLSLCSQAQRVVASNCVVDVLLSAGCVQKELLHHSSRPNTRYLEVSNGATTFLLYSASSAFSKLSIFQLYPKSKPYHKVLSANIVFQKSPFWCEPTILGQNGWFNSSREAHA